MAEYDGHSPQTSILVRVVRLIVPWMLLLIVGAVLWTFITDYRVAKDAAEAQGSTETTEQVGITPSEPYVIVLSDGLNLRAEASTGSAVVLVLSADQQLALVEEGLGWYRVRTADGVEGWVAAGGRYTQIVTP